MLYLCCCLWTWTEPWQLFCESRINLSFLSFRTGLVLVNILFFPQSVNMVFNKLWTEFWFYQNNSSAPGTALTVWFNIFWFNTSKCLWPMKYPASFLVLDYGFFYDKHYSLQKMKQYSASKLEKECTFRVVVFRS